MRPVDSSEARSKRHVGEFPGEGNGSPARHAPQELPPPLGEGGGGGLRSHRTVSRTPYPGTSLTWRVDIAFVYVESAYTEIVDLFIDRWLCTAPEHTAIDILARELPLPRAGEGGGEGCRPHRRVYPHGMVESHAANFSGDADAKAPSPQPSPRGRGSSPWRRHRNSLPLWGRAGVGACGVTGQSRQLPLPRAGEGGGEGCRRHRRVYPHGMATSHAANFSGDADAKAPSPQPSPRGRGSSPWRPHRNSLPLWGRAGVGACGVTGQSRQLPLPLPRAGEGGGEGCRRHRRVYPHGMADKSRCKLQR